VPGRADGHLRPTLLGRIGGVDLKMRVVLNYGVLRPRWSELPWRIDQFQTVRALPCHQTARSFVDPCRRRPLRRRYDLRRGTGPTSRRRHQRRRTPTSSARGSWSVDTSAVGTTAHARPGTRRLPQTRQNTPLDRDDYPP